MRVPFLVSACRSANDKQLTVTGCSGRFSEFRYLVTLEIREFCVSHMNPYRCSSNSQFSPTIKYMALVMRRRVRADTGCGDGAIPAALAASTGTVPATMTATRQTSGLVLAAVSH